MEVIKLENDFKLFFYIKTFINKTEGRICLSLINSKACEAKWGGIGWCPHEDGSFVPAVCSWSPRGTVEVDPRIILSSSAWPRTGTQ